MTEQRHGTGADFQRLDPAAAPARRPAARHP